MYIIFETPTTAKNEIRETNFRQFYPNINPALNWDNILPYINNAVRNYIYPHFGRVFYEEVVLHNTVDDFKDEIKEMMSNAIANYAVYLAMPHINVTIADMGVQQNRNEKSSNANQWSYNGARWAALYAAERQLDELLNYCYDNKSDAWLTTWAASDVYKFYFTDFISGRKQLSEFSAIKTMRGYWSVIPELRKAEDKVKKILGYRQYDDLLSQIDSPGDRGKEIIKQIRYFLADKALYESLPAMTVMIEDGSIYSVSVNEIPNIGVASSTNIAAINTLREQLKTRSAYYENEIRNFLHIYKDDFPLWKEDCWIEERPRSVFYSEDEVGGVMI